MFSTVIFITTLMLVGSKCASFSGFEIQTPEDCEGYLCFTKPANYDELEEFFDEKISEMNTTYEFNPMQDRYGGNMINFRSDDTENCASYTTTITPYTVIYNLTKTAVVQSKTLTQRVKITRCISIDAKCFNDLNFNAGCKTRNTLVQLMIYDEDKHELRPIDVPIPTDCYCDISV